MGEGKLLSQPKAQDAVKRWSIGLRGTILEDARGRIVLYQDYRKLRVAHDRVRDKLRQVSALYRKAVTERDAAQNALQEKRQIGRETTAELVALRKLAHVVARRVGNSAEVQRALDDIAAMKRGR